MDETERAGRILYCPVVRYATDEDARSLSRDYHIEHMAQRVDRHGFLSECGGRMHAFWVEATSVHRWLEAWLQNENVYRLGRPASRAVGYPEPTSGKRYLAD